MDDTVPISSAIVNTANGGLAENPAGLRGQPLALLPPTSPVTVDTSFPARQITFAGVMDGTFPGFVPVMVTASLSLPAIHQLTGVEAPVQLKYTQNYLTQGTQDPAVPYAQITQGAPLLKFASADQSGGLAQPYFTLTHLAQSTGLAPLDPTAANAQSLKDIFASFNLLGGVSLGDLLPVSAGAGTTPTIKTTTYASTLTVTTEMSWTLTPPTLQSAGPFQVNTDSTPGTQIDLNIIRVQSASASSNATTIHCELDNFTLSLLGIIDVQFNSFTFDHQPG